MLAPIGGITGAGLAGIAALAVWAGSGNPVLSTTMVAPAPPPSYVMPTTTYPPYVPSTGTGAQDGSTTTTAGTAAAGSTTTAVPSTTSSTSVPGSDQPVHAASPSSQVASPGQGSQTTTPSTVPPSTTPPTVPPTTVPPATTIPPATKIAPTTTAVGSAASYAFLVTNPDGSPVGFDPCIPIPWYLSTYEMPSGAAAPMTQAVSMVAAATGLDFVYSGTTPAPAWQAQSTLPAAPDGWPPVVIGWGHSNEGVFVSPNAPSGPLMGITQNAVAWQSSHPGYETMVGGVIEISLDNVEPAGFGPWQEGVVYLHELGHLVGLAHVADPAQIMHPGPDGQPGSYGAGDLTGLGILGHGACSAPAARAGSSGTSAVGSAGTSATEPAPLIG